MPRRSAPVAVAGPLATAAATDAAALARVLRLLAERPARLADGAGGPALVFEAGPVKRLRLATGALEAAARLGLLGVEDGEVRLTELGRARLARASHGADGFRRQHGEVVAASRPGADGVPEPVLVDLAESPLAWLAARKGRDGVAWIAPEECAAGERLRADYTRGQLMPRVTAVWAPDLGVGGRRSGAESGAAIFSDATVAARQRVDLALAAVGPEFAGLLVDVCCFLKGLETVETERRWPARSAKVVLKLALQKLARHYGLSAEARGRDRAKGLVHWGAEDYRPKVGAVEPA